MNKLKQKPYTKALAKPTAAVSLEDSNDFVHVMFISNIKTQLILDNH
jgi:hypothetical protein